MAAPDTVLAAQMYTLREFMKTPEDMAKTLKKVRDIGWQAVQLSGHGQIEDAEMKKMLDDNGLFCCATHEQFGKLQQEPQQIIDKLQLWECPNTAVGGMPGEYRNAEGYAPFAKLASEVGATLKKAGIRFGYHNHNFEFEKTADGRNGLTVVCEDSDPETVMMEIDTYWVQAGGGDPAQYLRQWKGRVPFIHLKDMVYSAEKKGPMFAEIGEGNMNWDAILAAAREADVEWYIVEQDQCERDPFESLQISLQNLNKMGLK